MSLVARYMELAQKMTNTGLSPRESREFENLKSVVTTEDLKQAQQTYAQKEALVHELNLQAYYRKARNRVGQVLKPCESNDRAIEDAHVEVELFSEFCKSDTFSKQFAWEDAPLPKKEALAKDREAFDAFCVANRYNAGTAGSS